MIQPWLVDLLVCPRCRASVALADDGSGLACAACRVVYPVVDGIPRMLPESAQPIGDPGARDDG